MLNSSLASQARSTERFLKTWAVLESAGFRFALGLVVLATAIATYYQTFLHLFSSDLLAGALASMAINLMVDAVSETAERRKNTLEQEFQLRTADELIVALRGGTAWAIQYKALSLGIFSATLLRAPDMRISTTAWSEIRAYGEALDIADELESHLRSIAVVNNSEDYDPTSMAHATILANIIGQIEGSILGGSTRINVSAFDIGYTLSLWVDRNHQPTYDCITSLIPDFLKVLKSVHTDATVRTWIETWLSACSKTSISEKNIEQLAVISVYSMASFYPEDDADDATNSTRHLIRTFLSTYSSKDQNMWAAFETLLLDVMLIPNSIQYCLAHSTFEYLLHERNERLRNVSPKPSREA